MSKISSSKPLNGIKVLELSNMITCSLATMTMASQGAEVIKIEPTAIGDKMRPLGTQKNGVSGFFHNCNRGKRSLAIDLKSSSGVKRLLNWHHELMFLFITIDQASWINLASDLKI